MEIKQFNPATLLVFPNDIGPNGSNCDSEIYFARFVMLQKVGVSNFTAASLIM